MTPTGHERDRCATEALTEEVEMSLAATNLESMTRTLVARGKGILAADESHPTMARRLAALGIEDTEESRRLYRQMLFTTRGLAAFISGVIPELLT